jgi:DNA repair protein RadC
MKKTLYNALRAAKPANVAEIIPAYSHDVKSENLPQITGVAKAAELLWPFFELPNIREEFKIILLDRRNRVLGVVNLSTGSVSGTVVDVPLILALACSCRASGVALAHNHPSGDTTPSEADKTITKKIKQALALVDIHLIDHFIFSGQDGSKYLSFVNEGLL